jgi:hypothetical protein
MADTSRDRIVYVDDIAGGADRIQMVSVGAAASLRLAPGAPREARARLLAPHDHVQCRPKADVPKAFHYGTSPRVPPILCTAEVGWYVTTHEKFAGMTDFNLGSHGYDPASPYMAIGFIAEGPAFKAGATLGAFDNVDVEPLIAQLLHLKGPRSDGSAQVFGPVLAAH